MKPGEQLLKHQDFPHIYHANGQSGRMDICTNCGGTSAKYWGLDETERSRRISTFQLTHSSCRKPKAVDGSNTA